MDPLKKKRIIIISVVAAVVLLASGGAVAAFNLSKAAPAQTATTAPSTAATTATTATTATAPAAMNQPTDSGEDIAAPTQAATELHEEPVQPTTVDIALPYAEGEVTRFSGSYVPDTRAEDTETGSVVHLRELFGAGYESATITFNEDGTFIDTLRNSAGEYQVQNSTVTAVYLPDETMDITVTEWSEDGKKPLTFCVVYRTVGDKGYKVFYSEKE